MPLAEVIQISAGSRRTSAFLQDSAAVGGWGSGQGRDREGRHRRRRDRQGGAVGRRVVGGLTVFAEEVLELPAELVRRRDRRLGAAIEVALEGDDVLLELTIVLEQLPMHIRGALDVVAELGLELHTENVGEVLHESRRCAADDQRWRGSGNATRSETAGMSTMSRSTSSVPMRPVTPWYDGVVRPSRRELRIGGAAHHRRRARVGDCVGGCTDSDDGATVELPRCAHEGLGVCAPVEVWLDTDDDDEITVPPCGGGGCRSPAIRSRGHRPRRTTGAGAAR